MPQIRAEIWQLGLLILCVPLQYYFVHNWGVNENDRSYALKQILSNLVSLKNNYLSIEPWKRWCFNLLEQFNEKNNSPWKYYKETMTDTEGESPAVEVMKYKHKEGHFSTTPEPRDPRNPYVKFRIGQVVIHQSWKYRGVIIGWDEKAKAPESWLDEMHGKNNPEWRSMPNYAIAVDIRDRKFPQITYVPEVNLQAVKHTKVMHPVIEDYFEKFDGVIYIPRPWLRALYPRD